MTVSRVHIATWQDASGFYTASTISTGAYATVTYDRSANAAVRQIKDYLQWQANQDDGLEHLEISDPEVKHVRISLRPYHETEERHFPHAYTIDLRIPSAFGRLEGGLWFAFLPTMQASFYVHAYSAFQRLAEEQVRTIIGRGSAREIAKYLQPKDIELTSIALRRVTKSLSINANSSLRELSKIAQPLGKPSRSQRPKPVFCRDEEIAAMTKTLANEGASMLLVGEPGVGKSAILEQAARGVVRDVRQMEGTNAPHRLWATSPGRLIAGMQYLGEWQKRLEEVIDEIGSVGGCLCIDSLRELVLTGDKDPRGGLAAFMLPYMEHGQLRLVAETTADELVTVQRLLPGFVEAFQRVVVDRLSPAACLAALQKYISMLSETSSLKFNDDVANTLLRLLQRFEPYRDPIAPGMDMIRRLSDIAMTNPNRAIDVDDAVEAYATRTGIPLEILIDNCPLHFAEVVDSFKRDVIGQDHACESVASVISTFKAGLNDPGRPLGVFLFCGPTGVGKTQLAKTLGNWLFGHGDHRPLIRLDMSEYGGPSAADRLMLKPDRSPSDWIQRVRRNPFCVVLLDEIEKANADVFDIIMGLFDEGRMHDAFGRSTNFRSSIVIMTSNLGSNCGRSIGFDDSAGQPYERAVRQFFRPEFFNRIDTIIPFHQLAKSDCETIVRKELGVLEDREGLARRNIRLQFDESIVNHLLEIGFDERFGARPLQRKIEECITALTAHYLAKNYRIRDTALSVSLGPDGTVVIQQV